LTVKFERYAIFSSVLNAIVAAGMVLLLLSRFLLLPGSLEPLGWTIMLIGCAVRLAPEAMEHFGLMILVCPECGENLEPPRVAPKSFQEFLDAVKKRDIAAYKCNNCGTRCQLTLLGSKRWRREP
jgi:predicted RNA-binding Zn-ribbon protein involved in translation (DUF1610 family)